MATPTKNKRIIIDYKNNPSLEVVISELEKLFPGMNKAEIVKLALIGLLKQNDTRKQNLKVVKLTE